MLEDIPVGAVAVLNAFPGLGAMAAEIFDVSFKLAVIFGEMVRVLMSTNTPPLNLARHPSILRIVHYKDVDGRVVLAHEHSGIQMLGIQLPPSGQGLQYILHDGTWVEPVLADRDIVLCNIGRMLASASNGRLRPSTHRVHAAEACTGYERWSAVLFAYPAHEQPQWTITEDGLKVHDKTWGDFIRNRFLGLEQSALRPSWIR